MTEKEQKLYNKISKKYRRHITELRIRLSDDYNMHGQRLYDYTLVYDNGEEHTFQNQGYMIYMLKEHTVNGYYAGP